MIDSKYRYLLSVLKTEGDHVVTRGAGVKSIFGYDFGKVPEFPIITVRKTAWKLALRELEWFISGEDACPEGVLRNVWWKGQLNPDHELRQGYPAQLRRPYNPEGIFDQVDWLRDEIKANPTSRRLCLTVWNPGSMAVLPDINKNAMTPTCCHMVWNQFQVRCGELHMNAVFRSTDAILGLPHNLVQHRALQLYFAHHAGVPASDHYNLYLNDVHYYDHPEHNNFVDWLDESLSPSRDSIDNKLVYTPSSVAFKADDFSVAIPISEPLYTAKITRTL